MPTGAPSFGSVVKIGNANPPTTTLAGVFDIAPPNLTRDALDVTNHASSGGAMEFIADGVFDPGDLVISINHVKGSTTDSAIRTLFSAGGNGYVQWTENAASGSGNITRAMVITGYQVDNLAVKGKQTAKLSMKLSGPEL
jgi:hypothetical protein